MVDLLDLPPSAFAARPPREPSPEELLEHKKAGEEIERALREWGDRLYESLVYRPPLLELPDDWRRRPEPKSRLQPQQELCRRVFRKLFPDGRIPDEVERSTESLRQDIATELEREAKQAGKKPLRTPSWDVVRAARRNP